MADKKSTLLDEGKLHFSTEGRLLQELGERLVASADLAIIELIKNAYDADSPTCRVSLSGDRILAIEDEGHGMTLAEFKSNWMTIATSSKQVDRTSRKYKRKLTGAKGIGRFAVRYLGRLLTLNSVAYDETRNSFTRLEADFDWLNVDKLSTLEQFEIPYKLFKLPEGVRTGTTLMVSGLRNEVIDKQRIKSEVLRIVSPLSGLEAGKFDISDKKKGGDPGFAVSFLEGFEAGQEVDSNLAKSILDNCWARLTISLEGNDLEYKISFNYSVADDEPPRFKTAFPNNISNGVQADIRFFPRRAGIFQAKGIDGTKAWTWIRENAGVGIVDHGFRIKPYGFIDDDWLNLDTDHSHSGREWRTKLMKDNFKMSDEQKKSPSLNPMLNIPVNTQLVGAVFVESRQRGSVNVNDLIPAMDREGFISNQAFRDLHDVVRAGIEFLALKDKEEEEKRAEKKAKEAAGDLRRDIRSAIHEVERNPTIPESEKNLIVETYGRLAKEIENVDEYYRTSRQNVELIGLLGVVSGYMTHETGIILNELKAVSRDLDNLVKQYPQLGTSSEQIKLSVRRLEGQIGYSQLFIQSIHNPLIESFNARSQIEYIIERFGVSDIKRRIEHIIDIDESLRTPPIHVAVYSGVFLNLYTNAVKAILLKNNGTEKGKILVRAVNTPDKHILEVFDNGVGIPESLRERIWDPLFSTTSRLNSPLGTGMGLGLSLVRKIVKEMNGSVRLVDPIKDYVTAFRVEYPFSISTRR